MTDTGDAAAGAGAGAGGDGAQETDVAAAIDACAAERRSGCLLIWREDAPDVGELFFARGRLVAATFHQEQGPPALAGLVRALAMGATRFFAGAAPERHNLDIAAESVAPRLAALRRAPVPRSVRGATARAAAARPVAPPFVPGPEWQEVPAGTPLPPGGEYHLELGGKAYARWPDAPGTPGAPGKSSMVGASGQRAPAAGATDWVARMAVGTRARLVRSRAARGTLAVAGLAVVVASATGATLWSTQPVGDPLLAAPLAGAAAARPPARGEAAPFGGGASPGSGASPGGGVGVARPGRAEVSVAPTPQGLSQGRSEPPQSVDVPAVYGRSSVLFPEAPAYAGWTSPSGRADPANLWTAPLPSAVPAAPAPARSERPPTFSLPLGVSSDDPVRTPDGADGPPPGTAPPAEDPVPTALAAVTELPPAPEAPEAVAGAEVSLAAPAPVAPAGQIASGPTGGGDAPAAALAPGPVAPSRGESPSTPVPPTATAAAPVRTGSGGGGGGGGGGANPLVVVPSSTPGPSQGPPVPTPAPALSPLATATGAPKPAPTAVPAATATGAPKPTVVPLATAPKPTAVPAATATGAPKPTVAPAATETTAPKPTAVPAATATGAPKPKPKPKPTVAPAATATTAPKHGS